MSVLESAYGFVEFLSGRGHIKKEVEVVYEPSGVTSSMVFDPAEGKYRISLSDANSLYHEISHIVLKEDGIEPLGIFIDPGAPEYVGHIAGSAVPNFYVNSLLQSFFDGEAPEGVLKGIELYRMDKEAQFNNSMTLVNFSSSKNPALGFYDMFAALSVARSLKLPGIAISLERLAAEADAVGGSAGFSCKLSRLRGFAVSLPDYGAMKRMCAGSPRPQAELTLRLFSLLSPGFSLGFREAGRERVIYFIKPLE